MASCSLRVTSLPLLLLALAAPFAASAQSTPAAPAAPAAAEAPPVSWPSPWRSAGTRLDYEVTTVTVRSRKGVETRVRNVSRQSISPDPALPAGGGQVWTQSGSRFDYSDTVPDDQRAMLESLASAMDGRALRIAQDSKGNATGVNNLAEVAPVIRGQMQAGLERAVQATLSAINEPGKRAEAEAALRPGMSRVLGVMGSDGALSAQLVELPAAYNFPGQGGMIPGNLYLYEESTPNPAGGDALPMLGSLRLNPARTAAGEVELSWQLALHPERAGPLLWDTVARLTGQAIPQDVRKGLPQSINISTSTLYRVNPATGVVTWLERTETRTILDSMDRTVTRMVLQPAR